MPAVCPPLSTGEDSFELQTVVLKMEALEKQIRELHAKHTQLRERKAVLETSRADAHLSQVNSRVEPNTPSTSTQCVSLPRPSAPTTRPAQVSFTPAPRHHGPWMLQQRKTRAKPRSRTSSPPTPPAFEISTENRVALLRETERDTMILGDSIVRHVRATGAKGKVHTRCFPGARVFDVAAQGLKKNWDELHHQYQGLSLFTDIISKKHRKERLESEMKQLEKDIELIKRHKIIYITKN
ncbi:hypothetical protein C0J45_4317 [Silurus meridionalis]|nr:hypothetical protein C0J45_4317 [Silurus meridionalis]